jgi:hypothetical protein
MGPSVLPRKHAYRPDLFDPKSLSTLAAVENAVCEFEGLLSRNNFEHIIDDLLSHPNRTAVELALSCRCLLCREPSVSDPISHKQLYSVGRLDHGAIPH